MLTNFQPYEPNEKAHPNAIYLRSEEGTDWYDAIPLFSQDTMKLVLDADGILRDLNQDASKLYPYHFSVAEVPVRDIPEEMLTENPRLRWRYVDEKLVPLPDERGRAQRLRTAQAAIAPLQDAVDLGIATDDELKMLALWKGYRVALARLDVSHTGKIDWPAAPREG